MKNYIVLILAILVLSSCEKRNCGCHKPKSCPSVNSESVPSKVKESFATRYQSTSSEQWYDKGAKGYAVKFTRNNIKNLAEFDSNGGFIAEQSENTCHKDDDDDDDDCDKRKHKDECNCSLSENND